MVVLFIDYLIDWPISLLIDDRISYTKVAYRARRTWAL